MENLKGKLIKNINLKKLTDSNYDFIANNYWQMSKEELKDILLEYIYICGNILEYHEGDAKHFLRELQENICDRFYADYVITNINNGSLKTLFHQKDENGYLRIDFDFDNTHYELEMNVSNNIDDRVSDVVLTNRKTSVSHKLRKYWLNGYAGIDDAVEQAIKCLLLKYFKRG